MKEFDDKWFKKECASLDKEKEKIPIGSLFLLQILTSVLNFLSKKEINTIEAYEKVKKELMSEILTDSKDEIKHNIRSYTLIDQPKIVKKFKH